MEAFINNYLAKFHTEYIIRQVLLIIAVYFAGYFFQWLLDLRGDMILRHILAFPFGLSLYVIIGYILLVFDLGFSRRHIFLAFLMTGLMLCILSKNNPIKRLKKKGAEEKSPKERKIFFIAIAALLLLSIISTVGIISVSLSNDSMYYFNLYSKAIVRYGCLKREYNVFLTDVGLGAAVIGSLSHLFGFGESFGIFTFFNLNFIAYFFYCCYRVVYLCKADKKIALIAAMAGSLSLATAMPFFIASRWVMANMYFMEYMFIALSLAYRLIVNDKSEPKADKSFLLLYIFIICLSMLRMEGIIIVIFLLLSISILQKKSRDFALFCLLPLTLLHIVYDYKVLESLGIIAPYTFLTREKAMIQALALLMTFIYLLFIKGRIGFLDKNLGKLMTLGLLAINLLLLIYDRELFINNLKVFLINLFTRAGWGPFPLFVGGITVLLLICSILDKSAFRLDYFTLLTLGYVLLTFAVSFARGNNLQEGAGDSGNRVLLQVLPLMVFTLYVKVCEALGLKDKDGR
ncbi:MAG: hypothetical protein K5931_07390 [Lachnospiraceae bacterium]|nr:hypothetical protein [Lachnospiraceae bacterium]